MGIVKSLSVADCCKKAGVSFLKGGFLLVAAIAALGAAIEVPLAAAIDGIKAEVIPTTEEYDAFFDYYFLSPEKAALSDVELGRALADLSKIPDLTPFAVTYPLVVWWEPIPFVLYGLAALIMGLVAFARPDKARKGALGDLVGILGGLAAILAVSLAFYFLIDLFAWPFTITYERTNTIAWVMILLFFLIASIPTTYVMTGVLLSPIAAGAERLTPLKALSRSFRLARHIRPKLYPAFFGFAAAQAAVIIFARPSLPTWACGALEGAAAGACALLAVQLFKGIRETYESREFLAPKQALVS